MFIIHSTADVNCRSVASCILIFLFLSSDMLLNTLILLPLLGCTWIIGMLFIDSPSEVLAWIFAIVNSLQVITSCISN